MAVPSVHQESAVRSPLSPDQSMPRHWAFAAAVAWENISIMLQDATLMFSTAYMLDQLAADFQADPLIQSDPQQCAIWANLREQIAPCLKAELRVGLVDTAPAPVEQSIGGG